MSHPQQLLFDQEYPTAVFSPCRRYRYALTRRWNTGPSVLFIGLNPSTADELQDDPTIRRCINFAKYWNFSAYVMANLFAFRATDPRVMMECSEPIGAANDAWLLRLARESPMVVAAWGNGGWYKGRGQHVIKLLEPITRLHRLGMKTGAGHPRHPLYVSGYTRLEPL